MGARRFRPIFAAASSRSAISTDFTRATRRWSAAPWTRARTENRPALVATFDPHPMRYFRPDLPPVPPDHARAARAADSRRRRRRDAGLPVRRRVRRASPRPISSPTGWCGGSARRASSPARTSPSARARGGDVDLLKMLGQGQSPVGRHGRAGRWTATAPSPRPGSARRCTPAIARPRRACSPAPRDRGRGRAWRQARPRTRLSDRQHRARQLLRPRYGVYAVRGRLDPDRVRAGWPCLDGVANLGIRPMFDPPKELLEPHFFDFDGDLYGQRIEVELISFLRDEFVFDDIEALKAQIARDAEQARGRLAK